MSCNMQNISFLNSIILHSTDIMIYSGKIDKCWNIFYHDFVSFKKNIYMAKSNK